MKAIKEIISKLKSLSEESLVSLYSEDRLEYVDPKLIGIKNECADTQYYKVESTEMLSELSSFYGFKSWTTSKGIYETSKEMWKDFVDGKYGRILDPKNLYIKTSSDKLVSICQHLNNCMISVLNYIDNNKFLVDQYTFKSNLLEFRVYDKKYKKSYIFKYHIDQDYLYVYESLEYKSKTGHINLAISSKAEFLGRLKNDHTDALINMISSIRNESSSLEYVVDYLEDSRGKVLESGVSIKEFTRSMMTWFGDKLTDLEYLESINVSEKIIRFISSIYLSESQYSNDLVNSITFSTELSYSEMLEESYNLLKSSVIEFYQYKEYWDKLVRGVTHKDYLQGIKVTKFEEE